MLDCLGFRGLMNRDVKESDRFELELTVPVNLLLFSGASSGGGAGCSVGGRKPANVVRGKSASDGPRASMEYVEYLNNVRHPTKKQTFDCRRVVRRRSIHRGRTGTQLESVILGLGDSRTAGESRSAYVAQVSWMTVFAQGG